MKKIMLTTVVLLLAISILIAEQVERDMVVLEIGTGTWCYYCPGAAMGAEDLIANGCDVAVIEYHNGDPFANSYASSRINYYGITGFPTAFFDGVLSVVGGSHSSSMYPYYLPRYNTRKAINSSFTIGITGEHSGLDYDVTVTVNKVAETTSTNMVLHLALTESMIHYNWQGMTELNYVERLMVPNQYGTPLDFSSDTTNVVNLSFTLNADWVADNCELVAFVQDTNTKEVLQGSKVSLPNLPTNEYTIEIPLNQDWNWISFNVHPDDTSLDNVFYSLTSCTPAKIYQVKNQMKSATWYGSWVGNLTEITDGEGYLVNMNEPAPDYSLTGIPIDVSNSIFVNEGWNWIGYYPQVPIDITPALASIQENANQIKNQTQSATWYGVWVGNLTQMEPGVGYKLLMNADDELIYPEEKGIVTTSYNSDNIMNWKVISGTQYNMVVIAKVMLNEDVITNGVLGAFDKQGNCRSVGKLEDGFWYLTIVGNTENEEISFELYDEVTGKIYNSNETVIFIDNTTIGTPDNPMSITMTGGVNSNLPTAYKLEQNYPNPFNPCTTVSFDLPHNATVNLTVYNIKGQEVMSVEKDITAGYKKTINLDMSKCASGIYFYRLSAKDYTDTKKMILMK